MKTILMTLQLAQGHRCHASFKYMYQVFSEPGVTTLVVWDYGIRWQHEGTITRAETGEVKG
jgi:hypothetical protein